MTQISAKESTRFFTKISVTKNSGMHDKKTLEFWLILAFIKYKANDG
jgi:hypothetical protein